MLLGRPVWAADAKPGGVPANGALRGLVIGVNAYKAAAPLRGAVADAQDLSAALRSAGAHDVVLLADREATRVVALEALAGVTGRARAGDLVVIAFAGLASLGPQHGRVPRSTGLETAYVLAGYDPADERGRDEKLIDTEFSHVVHQIEAKGARALLVLDACGETSAVREADPRGNPLVMRGLPPTQTPDRLAPVSDDDDARATPGPFARSTVMLACDEGSSAPEVTPPGGEGWRGALSYAVARSFEGHGDLNQDGVISGDEFVGYVRQVAYQLSAQRQIVLTFEPSGTAQADGFAEASSRAIVAVPKGSSTAGAPGTGNANPPTGPLAAAKQPPSIATLRMASTGDASLLPNLSSSAVLIKTVSLRENPELIWDPVTGDVLAGSDVIASRLSAERLRGAVERTVAVRKLKQLSVAAPESVRVLPNDKLHYRGSLLSVRIDAGTRTSVVVFNIAGDGTVQLLFPRSRDPRRAPMPFELPKIEALPPFGADTVVVVASEEPLSGLEQAIASLDNRQRPIQAAELVERLMPAASRLGLVSLFTAP
ncbi:caspase family protein [Alsobacter metallidurans]|nr:caspase family protein [Alsobacter metallidurans]